MEYIKLTTKLIGRPLFAHFRRRQKVSRCWRKIGGKWCIREIAFLDDWTPEDYDTLIACLKHTVASGGVVFGAFLGGELKGFASVEPALFGGKKEYLDLSSIHVSEDLRGHGVGKELFWLCSDWAKKHGARKLYISAHSSVETQAFYKAMGCVEALEYHKEHVSEPDDCQLECVLKAKEDPAGMRKSYESAADNGE